MGEGGAGTLHMDGLRIGKMCNRDFELRQPRGKLSSMVFAILVSWSLITLRLSSLTCY